MTRAAARMLDNSFYRTVQRLSWRSGRGQGCAAAHPFMKGGVEVVSSSTRTDGSGISSGAPGLGIGPAFLQE